MAALDSGSRGAFSTWSARGGLQAVPGESNAGSSGGPSTAERRLRIRIDGIPFDALSESGVVDHVFDALRESRGGCIITPNVDILRQLRGDGLAELTESADLVVPDGMPIVWASRLQGQVLPERVAGSSLIWSLAQRAAETNYSLYLLGGAEGIAERAAGRLSARFSDLSVAGWACPPFGFEKDQDQLETTISAVVEAKPDIVFVALGFPKQERLMEILRQQLPRTWFVGCGGGLTMAAGEVSRAPIWVQRSGFEWVHRMAMEPRRMARRYLVHDVPYAAGLMLRSVGARFRAG